MCRRSTSVSRPKCAQPAMPLWLWICVLRLSLQSCRRKIRQR
nr:MAG TPA: hypothetical protein [Caudoviricetes sp.]